MQDYKEAINAFHQARGLDPTITSAQRSLDLEGSCRGVGPSDTGDEIVRMFSSRGRAAIATKLLIWNAKKENARML
jgi:hypothetical protein